MEMKKTMKKSGKIALWVVGVILFLIIVTVSALACVAAGAVSDNPMKDDYSDWMSYIDDGILLKNAVIPGSHDAATKSMIWMGETQSLTVGEQLRCGVRYFDVRIKKTDDGYVIFHGPLNGPEADGVFDDVAEFLSKHADETVILDFQHFKDGSESWVAEKTENVLGDYLVRNDGKVTDAEFIDGLTIGAARGKCLVFWGRADENIEKDFLFLRNDDEGNREGSCLQSYYNADLNEGSSADYVENSLQIYIDKYKETNKGMFVLQGQLTDALYVFGPKFREATHANRMSNYIKNLSEHKDFGYINIIMRDYMNSEKAAEIIALNYRKGTVKEGKREEFTVKFC